jgi:membrane protease YdiL (CAAX protease family)
MSTQSKLLAPRWHTAILVAIFLGLTISGAWFQSAAQARPGMLQQHTQLVPLYLSLIVLEWALFYYVWKGGLQRTGTGLADVIDGNWSSVRNVAVDVGLAAGLWIVWKLFQTGWDYALGAGHAASIQTMLPTTPIEILLWLGVSLSAGICEEFAFRGYLQRQFTLLTRSAWVALLLQAGLFGISHGYQGIAACVRIAVFGVLYGLFARWRGSLRPGMIGHTGSDILSGIFGL